MASDYRQTYTTKLRERPMRCANQDWAKRPNESPRSPPTSAQFVSEFGGCRLVSERIAGVGLGQRAAGFSQRSNRAKAVRNSPSWSASGSSMFWVCIYRAMTPPLELTVSTRLSPS
jgi:hypothetical protein